MADAAELTRRMFAVAERDEQHRSDVALLACPTAYLARIGITPDAIEAAERRAASYVDDVRAILRGPARPATVQLAAFDVEPTIALFDLATVSA